MQQVNMSNDHDYMGSQLHIDCTFFTDTPKHSEKKRNLYNDRSKYSKSGLLSRYYC